MNPSDLEAIQKLKAEWDSLQPLSKENDDRLWRKLRLEWDYHSNHIEGNTLTYGETELLIVFGETSGSHTLREYEEMKAHDVAILHVRELAEEARPLTETDVRGLNKLLLKEPFWKPAITADGATTRKQIVPGQYKTQPNNVRTATHEIFYFVDPLDVPKRMQDYLGVLNAKCPAGRELLIHLARIHHEFLLIHPFDDGNGRVGRLLLNYVLMRAGYPPIIIRAEQKSGYLSALHRADTQQPDYSELADFLASALHSSLEMGIKAAKGEPVRESFDADKEIDILAKEHAVEGPPSRTQDLVSALVEKSLKPLFRQAEERATRLKKLFSTVEFGFLPSAGNPNWEDTVNRIAPQIWKGGGLSLSLGCEHYNGKNSAPFNVTVNLAVNFEKYDYQVSLNGRIIHSNPYSRQLVESEIADIVGEMLGIVLEIIRKKTEQK